MSDNTSSKGNISRRQMLRLTAVGAVGLATGAAGKVFAATSSPEVTAARIIQDQVKLRIQVNDAKSEKPFFDLFQAKFPNIQVEMLEVTGIDHEEVASKILSMIAAGTPPDIGYAATEALELYAGEKLAAPLTDRVKGDASTLAEYFKDVHPSLVEAMMYEGDLYELPRDFNAANIYYNTKLLKDAGLDAPKADWTKDDFVKYATAMTKKDSSGKTTIYGYGWTNRLWGSWMPWIFVNGGNLMSEEHAPGGDWMWSTFYKDDPAAQGRGGGWRWLKAMANQPSNVEALEFVVQLTKDNVAPSIDLGTGQSLEGFFTSGKLGMIPAGGFWSGGLHNLGMAPDAFDVQLWPKWKNQRHQFGTGGHWLAGSAKNADAGWSFLKFEASLEGMKANGLFNPVTLTTPVRRSMNNAERYSVTGPKNWQVFYDTLDKHPDTAPIPAPPKSNQETQLFVKYTGLAMTGDMTPQEALDGLQKDLEAVLARK